MTKASQADGGEQWSVQGQSGLVPPPLPAKIEADNEIESAPVPDGTDDHASYSPNEPNLKDASSLS
jgi:hypothetical protein